MNPIINLMFAVAIIVFIWGIVVYIKDADSDTARKKGAQHMLWGVIGLFIMVAVVGILRVVKNTIFG